MVDLNSVDNVASLKSVIGSDSQPVAEARGYWQVGDGGGGTFYWDASSITGDNGVSASQLGTIIVPTNSTTGRWVRSFSGPINVKWFGARGERTDFDDAPAINRAVQVAGNTEGGNTVSAVFIPRGVYRLKQELNMFPFVRLLGEGKASTFLVKEGNYADTIIFNSTCILNEVAHLAILPFDIFNGKPTSGQTSGAAIRFSQPVGPTRTKLYELDIDAYQGIAVEGPVGGDGFRRSKDVHTVTVERVNIVYDQTGIKLCYAINWTLQNIILISRIWEPPAQSNKFGIWIDTETEGCIFNGIFSLGGEHCWRIARTINTGSIDRAPSENRFYSCIGDNGSVSCLYISNIHRGLFTNCWYSDQKEHSDAAVVMDNLDIWGVQWVSCQFVNIRGAGIQVNAATSFTIMNSTFSEWDLDGLGFSAIDIHPHHRTNFSIIGNQFIRDNDDFATHKCNFTIKVNGGRYNRYIISNNMSYSGTEELNLGMGKLFAISDEGQANNGKVVNNNL